MVVVCVRVVVFVVVVVGGGSGGGDGVLEWVLVEQYCVSGAVVGIEGNKIAVAQLFYAID